MSNIRLIISDIDGTILTSNHQVDEQLIEVMPELEKANIPFVLASARSPLGMQPIAHKLGLHDNPIACYNGALVLEGDRTIIQHPVDKAEIQELLIHRLSKCLCEYLLWQGLDHQRTRQMVSARRKYYG